MAPNSQWQRQKLVLLPIIVILIGGKSFFAYMDLRASRARDSIIKFLDAIRHIRYQSGHHSGPEHRIFVEVKGKQGQLELVLARDSGNRDEYWVFWSKEAGKESRQEIGRINTSFLDRE